MVITATLLASCGDGGSVASTTTLVVTSTSTTINPTTSCPAPSTTTSSTTSSLPISPSTSATIAPATTTATRPSTTTPGLSARVVRQAETDRRVVLLTFDAGSDRGYADEILDLLAVRGIQASFGLTGCWAESSSDLVVRMAAEGHTLINHTYDHPHMETLDTPARLAQLRRTDEIITRLTGRSTKPYFRPPYGSYDQGVLADAGAAGYAYSVMWTVDSLGWKSLDPEMVAARVINAAQPGAIILLHVGAASTDYQALPQILDALDSAGYGFVTLSELIG